MSIPKEEYFIAMMESVWHLCEDESATVAKEQLEFLTKAIR